MAIKIRNTGRYREIVVALVRHGFGYMVEEMGLFHILAVPKKWIRRTREEPTKTLGERIRLILEELGPTFIKLGQLSSTRQDLLDDEVIEELQKLQDQVPPFPMEQVRAIIEQELNKRLEDIFAEFREEPLAAASIGQVHYARLKTGERVAVKVRRPQVDEVMERDLEIMLDLAALAERRVEWASRYRIRTIVDELAKSMRKELDFEQEGKNAEKLARQFARHPYIVIPKVYGPYTTPKVLTLEYVDGIKLSNTGALLEAGHHLRDIAEHLVQAMFQQVLIDGFFHADPHPGNVFVLPDGKLAFVDFGLVGRLNEEMREHLSTLLIALMRRDSDGIVRGLFRLGLISDEVDTDALRQDLDELRDQYYDIPLSQVSLGKALNELFVVANRHRILIPTDLTLLGKALITVEGVAEKLYPELSLVKLAEPFGRRLVREQFQPARIRKKWGRLATEFIDVFTGFPRQASLLTKMIRSGKLKVDIGMPEMDLLLRKLDQISNRITVSIVLLSFSIIMVGLIVAWSVGKVPPVITHFPVIEVGSAVAGFMFLWLLYSIFRSGRS